MASPRCVKIGIVEQRVDKRDRKLVNAFIWEEYFMIRIVTVIFIANTGMLSKEKTFD